MASKTRSPKSKHSGDDLASSPNLVTHRVVAEKFGVTTTLLRRWVQAREFPAPHAVIGQTLFFRADFIEYKLRTGGWPAGVRFRGDARTKA